MANRIPAELQLVIVRMTAWQRNQWARAGYPVNQAHVERFARLQRDGTELHRGDILPPAKE